MTFSAKHAGEHCYWCARTTIAYDSRNPTHPLGATCDHVRSRPECMTKAEYNHRRNKVLACYECNQRRSNEWLKKYQSGQVFRTEFAEKEKAKWRKRKQKFEAIKKLREKEAKCFDPHPGLKIIVPPELSEAFG